MKRLFVIILGLAVALNASAQWKVSSIDSSDQPGTPLLQVIQTDSTTLVFATFTRADANSGRMVCINRKTAAYVNGMKYKLKTSVGIPVQDDGDSKTACLDNPGDRVNYVMVFEKFPVEDGFDIIENASKHNTSMFNFQGVHVTGIEPSKVIDAGRFLDSTEVPVHGVYRKDGAAFGYYIRDGVVVTMNCEKNGNDVLFYVRIMNGSKHGVTFDFDKVRITGIKAKRNGDEETAMTKYTPDSYEQSLERDRYVNQKYSGQYEVNHLVDTQLTIGYIGADNPWARIGLEALRELNNKIEDDDIQKYLNEHPDNSPKALRSNSLKPGESIYGYIAARNKRYNSCRIVIPMDSYDFTEEIDL